MGRSGRALICKRAQDINTSAVQHVMIDSVFSHNVIVTISPTNTDFGGCETRKTQLTSGTVCVLA